MTQDTLGPIVLVIGFLLVYFLPLILATHHRDRAAIGVLNLFLGWTLLGWVVALVWANIDRGPRPQRP